MSKKSFTSGQVLTAAQMNTLQTNDYNWSVNAKTASYILAGSDVGTRITMNSATATTVTVNTATLSAGDVVYILNIGAGICTITAGSGTTVVSAGLLGLGQYAGGYLFAVSSTSFYFIADGVSTSGIGTSLPATPYDGQKYVLVDSVSAPTYRWAFQYNASSSSAYKWEFIGGSAGFSEVTTYEALTSTGSYLGLTTAGPSFALPRAGDYLIAISALAFNGTASTPSIRMSYDIGATGAVDADAGMVQPTSTNQGIPIIRERVKTGLTAVTLTAKYKTNVQPINFQDRWMRVTPIRVS